MRYKFMHLMSANYLQPYQAMKACHQMNCQAVCQAHHRDQAGQEALVVQVVRAALAAQVDQEDQADREAQTDQVIILMLIFYASYHV
jgi:hypothetical protein